MARTLQAALPLVRIHCEDGGPDVWRGGIHCHTGKTVEAVGEGERVKSKTLGEGYGQS